MNTFQDLRYGARTLVRAPGFAVVSVLTLALGLGATSLVFSFVTAVLTAATPAGNMDRLAGVWSHNRAQGETKNVVSIGDFIEWRRRQQSFELFAAQRRGAVNLSGGDQPLRVPTAFVTAEFYAVFGIRPALGRAFTPEEERPGAPRVAMLSHRLWTERFGGRPGVLGREILLDGRPTSIVGVLPPLYLSESIAAPLTIDPASPAYGERALFVMARLHPGVALEQARAEMHAIGEQLEREFPDTHRGWGVNTRPLQEEFVGPQARLVFALLAAAAGAVLLIGCANIANLLLARGLARTRELAVRTALGASRLRLIRQMLAEGLVLAACGGTAGLLVAHWGLAALRSFLAVDAAVLERAVVDGRVLAFAAAASMLSMLFFGLMPALRGARPDLNQTLRDGSRASGGPQTRRLRGVLVAGEVALAVVLLVVSMLFLRTLAALQRIEPGFDTRNLLTLRVSLPESRYADGAAVASFYDRVLARLASSPGVLSVGAGLRVPAAGSRYNPNRSLAIEGRPAARGETRSAADLTVTPGYLETLRIGLREGRLLASSDGADAPLVVVISDTTARRYWPHASPLGARIRLGDEASPSAWRTVVGIVGDVRNDDIDSPPVPHVYVPLAQRRSREMTIVLRTAGNPLDHVAAARTAVASADPNQPVYEVKSMDQILDEDLRESVVLIAMTALFAGVALLLAAIGIYGVVSHAVAQRTHEIGVRMALGAAVADVLRLVVRQAFTPVAVGLAIGIAFGLAASRLVASILYGVTPTDPLTYGSVILILAAVALLASVAPALRATGIDPLIALKYE